MLIEYRVDGHVVMPAGSEVVAGSPVTVRNGKIFPLSPGCIFKGFAAQSVCCVKNKPKIVVYFQGELATSYFDSGQDYEPLDSLYINKQGLLTNIRTRDSSDEMGVAVEVGDYEGIPMLRFWMLRSTVLPMS